MAKNSPSPSDQNPLELIIYVREGCHLCEDMIFVLQQYQARQYFSLNVIDVDSDSDLQSRYGVRVPVLATEENEICHYHLDHAAFEKLFLPNR